ncbi:LON peptidase substrate-binding domain-containing protein [Pelagibacterales bacterium SAG-MED15]|nr:LON peptidase substrate-binding domain-containing protein [Pelagibacterales bacterium SAG-MED15]
MQNNKKLPEEISIFPLSNFIIFPESTVPLNIFEPRYVQMIDDAMKSHRMIGMVQPKKTGDLKKPNLYNVGCVGKITSFNETDDGRYLIVLNGISRFEILKEISTNKLYRVCKVNYEKFSFDLKENREKINFSNLETILKDLKSIFNKKGYAINWSELEKQDLYNTINTLSMASPISLEEKQTLLESLNVNDRKLKLEKILKTYLLDNFQNNTLQ